MAKKFDGALMAECLRTTIQMIEKGQMIEKLPKTREEMAEHVVDLYSIIVNECQTR